jgi:predicted transcriptional regulator
MYPGNKGRVKKPISIGPMNVGVGRFSVSTVSDITAKATKQKIFRRRFTGVKKERVYLKKILLLFVLLGALPPAPPR